MAASRCWWWETQQQQKSSAPLMQNEDDRTEPIAAVEDWLFSAEFNDRIEPPSDTPVDQELDELADLPPPAPEDEAVNSDTLTTIKIIQQELAEAELSECTQPLADEPALPPSALLENLSPPEAEEDVGFEDPYNQDVGPSVQNDAGVEVLPDSAELDSSEPIHHTPKPFNMSPFIFAFALWEK